MNRVRGAGLPPMPTQRRKVVWRCQAALFGPACPSSSDVTRALVSAIAPFDAHVCPGRTTVCSQRSMGLHADSRYAELWPNLQRWGELRRSLERPHTRAGRGALAAHDAPSGQPCRLLVWRGASPRRPDVAVERQRRFSSGSGMNRRSCQMPALRSVFRATGCLRRAKAPAPSS